MAWMKDKLLAVSILVLAVSLLIWTFHPARDTGRYSYLDIQRNSPLLFDSQTGAIFLPAGKPLTDVNWIQVSPPMDHAVIISAAESQARHADTQPAPSP